MLVVGAGLQIYEVEMTSSDNNNVIKGEGGCTSLHLLSLLHLQIRALESILLASMLCFVERYDFMHENVDQVVKTVVVFPLKHFPFQDMMPPSIEV